VEPPEKAVSAEFGEHLAQVCVGCHRANFEGGPIGIGPPDWPAAGNLTRHPEGLATWSYEDFVVAMREAERPDGVALRPPMTRFQAYAAELDEVEMRAMWTYLRDVEAVPVGE